LDVARLNFSHGDHDGHKRAIATLREVSSKSGKPIALLQDLQGPKIRTGKLAEDSVELRTGQRFVITTEEMLGNSEMVSTTYKNLAADVQPGNTLLIDDGMLRLKVLETDGTKVTCEVLYGGTLKNNKGINLPEVKMTVPALTDKDKQDLRFGLEQDVDFIALSFVREGKDVQELKDLIAEAGKDIPVIAKIEKPQALHNIDEILDVADGIMVARGDLGVELNPEKVPVIQKFLIKKANARGAAVITATQMLESMISNPSPTRAEASDVANAIFDDSDAVMLSGETAFGKFPVETVKMMSRIIQETERAISYPRAYRSDIENHIELLPGVVASLSEGERDAYRANNDFINILSRLASQAARETDAKALVVLTDSIDTVRRISKYRTNCPILGLSPDGHIQRQMALQWGVIAYVPDENLDLGEDVSQWDAVMTSSGLLSQGDAVVVISGSQSMDKALRIHIVGGGVV
jgi:pyruvate kinase